MISVAYKKPNFLLTFDFNQHDLKVVRALPVRNWIKDKKVWEVPELVAQTLNDIPELVWEKEAFNRKEVVEKAILKLVDYKFSTEGDENEYLRPYQQIGVNFLIRAKKALLADDMGLGKSLQALQAIFDLELDNNLIICPATLKLNWANEFVKHFGIEPIVISGTAKKRQELWAQEGNFYIANYDIISKDWGVIKKEWDSIICDEAVYLKNPSAQRTKFVKRLKSDVKIGLSGMPIEINLLELHSILDWIRPEVLPSYNRFKYRYINYDWNGKITGYKNLEELHLLTSPYILRRKKQDVLKELPPKIYSDFPLELDKKTSKAYEAICDEFLQWLREQTGKNWHASVLEKIIRLRQFVEFPEIVGFDDLASVKLEWLKETYENVKKIVVFTYFRDSVELLRKEFNTDFILTGSTPNDDRVGIVERFNEADEGMFVLTDAGKFGLNITGAKYITNFGYFYNPATMLQREDRLHRIGQQETVNVLNPYIVGTIDEGIRSIFLKRKEEAHNFMEDSEKMSISNLSKEDFRKMVVGGIV